MEIGDGGWGLKVVGRLPFQLPREFSSAQRIWDDALCQAMLLLQQKKSLHKEQQNIIHSISDQCIPQPECDLSSATFCDANDIFETLLSRQVSSAPLDF